MPTVGFILSFSLATDKRPHEAEICCDPEHFPQSEKIIDRLYTWIAAYREDVAFIFNLKSKFIRHFPQLRFAVLGIHLTTFHLPFFLREATTLQYFTFTRFFGRLSSLKRGATPQWTAAALTAALAASSWTLPGPMPAFAPALPPPFPPWNAALKLAGIMAGCAGIMAGCA